MMAARRVVDIEKRGLTATLGDLMKRHPPRAPDRIANPPLYLRRGNPLDMAWALKQTRLLAVQRATPEQIAEVMARVGVSHADGRPLDADTVRKWLAATDDD